MFDLCSTDHYITHKKAKRLGCTGVEVELIVEGIKGMEYREHTMLYNVSLIDKNGLVNQYQCYVLKLEFHLDSTKNTSTDLTFFS